MSTHAQPNNGMKELLALPEVRKIFRWRLPNSDGEYKAQDSVAFAKSHSKSFFSAVRKALSNVVEKHAE